MVAFHSTDTERVLKELKASPESGLSQAEATRRLNQNGPNVLDEGKKISPLTILARQFNNFLVWILVVAVVISAILGDIVESAVILIIIVVNAVIGFAQEYRAEKAIEALKKLAGLKADVLRDGEKQQVESAQLVQGDIIFLETGDKIPADCRILEQSNFETLESSLTGESTPVAKTAEAVKEEAPIADRKCMAFSGTIVTKGRAKAVVTGTGMKTEIGRIAKLIEEAGAELTPLQKQLEKFGKQIGIVTLAISGIVFAATLLRAEELSLEFILSMFETAVSLAVAAIPEGLPAVVAISLALGVQRMVKRHALVRKLPSVETLGSTTVIATDKTGTLTMDKMTVKKLYVHDKVVGVEGAGYETQPKIKADENEKLLLRIGALCNDSELSGGKVMGDPTEGALVVSAAKAGLERKALNAHFRRVDEIPFDSSRKLMSTVHLVGRQKVMYTKGAPDVVLRLCDYIYANGKARKLNKADRKRIEQANAQFASEALRVLGFAYKQIKGNDKSEKKLVFVGLQAMIDPPRPEVPAAIKKCKKAGIRVVMITGDHEITAAAIARNIGIEGRSMSGEELDKVKDISTIINEVSIFARVSPEHKIRIIDALKKEGHITAMTGDGVNDAPALKKADIGIGMGINGTDVAKEASTMILTDDNFASIVNAVEEGRGIYDNIRKFIYFLLSSNIAEVLIIFLAVIIGLKLPLLAIQLLWLNLITDGLPAIALGVEPIAKHIMEKKPRKAGRPILDRAMVVRLVFRALIITAGTLGVYVWALYSKGWQWGQNLAGNSPAYIYGVTMTFTVLVMFELFNSLAAKSEDKHVYGVLFTNKWLWMALASSFALHLAVLYTPLNAHFGTMALGLSDWLLIGMISLLSLAADSIYKLFHNRLAEV